VTPRCVSRYSTGPMKPMTKSRSGAAQAKKPAAMRLGSERGGASFDAVACASSAPESAWVSVSRRYVELPRSHSFAGSRPVKLRTMTRWLRPSRLMK
jgi:hypothetical protein